MSTTINKRRRRQTETEITGEQRTENGERTETDVTVRGNQAKRRVRDQTRMSIGRRRSRRTANTSKEKTGLPKKGNGVEMNFSTRVANRPRERVSHQTRMYIVGQRRIQSCCQTDDRSSRWKTRRETGAVIVGVRGIKHRRGERRDRLKCMTNTSTRQRRATDVKVRKGTPIQVRDG